MDGTFWNPGSLILLSGILVFQSCTHQTNRPYAFPETPAGTVPQPTNNIATEKGVELGRLLFFDPLLSKNHKLSCASCHHTDKAFSDGVGLSESGVSGKPLLRHAPALFNLAWYPRFFWDGGASTLESQVFGPLMHPDEMAMDIREMVQRLQADELYPSLFEDAWGTDSITSMLVARSLAQYERTLLSFQSRFDRLGPQQLRPAELRGFAIYQKHCASCHPAPLFTDLDYHANGIDTAFTDKRFELIFMGRYRITLDSADIGRYRTPSLRNLGFTAPYMHDGRFTTLDQVLDHYAQNHQGNTGADSLVRGMLFYEVKKEDREALKAFLHSLNDTAFTRQKP